MGIGGDKGGCPIKFHFLRKFCPTSGRFSARLRLIFANFSKVWRGAAAPGMKPLSLMFHLCAIQGAVIFKARGGRFGRGRVPNFSASFYWGIKHLVRLRIIHPIFLNIIRSFILITLQIVSI